MAKLPSTSLVVLVFGLLHVLVAVVFLKGFLLTRVELPDVAAATAAPSNGLKPYSKAVVLIVDALRHDFLCAQPGGEANHLSAGLMPRTLGLVNAAAGAALAARFIADTPTITMSRLKAILTGGLPTFLDVGQSFSASALTEDNLLLQLQTQQKRMVVMGDDTWMQLAQGVFTEAYPYPSFDVHDLHTVDDGVAEHLLPLLAQPDSWDVLLAHYLGVDHAGHSHGVNSRQMAAKLTQMDEQVSHVIETLVAQAGPGGAYQDALLLVLSDHGQTLGGDHGGGSPAETDSVLVAMSLARAHAALQQPDPAQPAAGEQAAGGGNGSSFELVHRLAAAGGYLDISPASLAAAAASEACAGSQQQCRRPEEPSFWLCGTQMSQIDLTPTLAHLLGVAIPFGNLGRLPPQLYWALARQDNPRITDYSAALQQNAEQVHSYLNRYAAVGGLPAAQLASINRMFLKLQAGLDSTEAEPHEREGPATEARVLAQLAFLAAAADLARKRFTLFQQGPMWAGCGLGAVVLAVQLLYCWHAVRGLHRAEAPQAATTRSNVTVILFTCLAAFHALGLFSVGLLMGEGRLQCVLLAAVALLLARATLASVLAARSVARTRQPASCVVRGTPAAAANGCAACGDGPHVPGHATTLQWWRGPWPAVSAAGAAVALLACNVALQALGLIDRVGQDPHDKTQPSADLLVGPDAAWQRALYCAATIGPLAALWALARRCSRRGWSCVGATQPGRGAVERSGAAACVVVCLCQSLAGVQFVALCVFWVAQLTGSAEESVASVAKLLWQQHLARQLPWLQAAIASVPGLRLCASAGRLGRCSACPCGCCCPSWCMLLHCLRLA